MRESYGTLFDRFFDGPTGREIQAHGKDAFIVAVYLTANKYANMLGLYELPIVTIAHHLPVLGPTFPKRARAVVGALDALRDTSFAYFDEATSFIWVREMARIRLQLAQGDSLSIGDKRLKSIADLYASLKPNALLLPFLDRYAIDLHLTARSDLPPPLLDAHNRGPTEGASEGASQGAYEGALQGARQGAVEGPSNGASDGACHASKQVQVQKQVQKQIAGTGTSNQKQLAGSGTGTGTKEKAAAAPPRSKNGRDHDDAEENVEVITKLIRESILPLGLGEDDIIDAIKDRCANLRIDYNSGVISKALASARVRQTLTGARS